MPIDRDQEPIDIRDYLQKKKAIPHLDLRDGSTGSDEVTVHFLGVRSEIDGLIERANRSFRTPNQQLRRAIAMTKQVDEIYDSGGKIIWEERPRRSRYLEVN